MGDPEKIFEKRERIGKGSFGEVFKGYVVTIKFTANF
jgi:hypothetical protein